MLSLMVKNSSNLYKTLLLSSLYYCRIGVLPICIFLFLQGCSDTPSTPKEHIAQGDQLLESGNAAEAVAAYRMALHQDTLNPTILARLSKAYRAQKKPVAADRFLRKAMNIPYEEGISALLAGNDSAAIAAFERTLDIFPRHPLALNKLGDIFLARDQADKALIHYEKSTEANPKFANTWVKLGRLYATKKMIDKSKSAYLKAIDRNINSYRSYLGLGQIYLEEQLWMDAAEQFDKALLIDPQSTAARAGINEARSHF
jgi:superkiller protein 3